MAPDGSPREPGLFEPVVPPRPAPHPWAVAGVREPDPPPHSRSEVDPPTDRAVVRDRVAWLGVLALGAVAVWRIATASATAPITAEEARLADGAYTVLHLPAFPVTAGELVEIGTRVQLTGYAWLTGALNRHDSVTGAGRELGVVAVCTAIAALLLLGRRYGVRPAAAAIALAGLILTPAAVNAIAVFGAGMLGAAWTVVGVALLTGTGLRRGVGVTAILLGVITAPLIAVPVGAAVAGATARRWAPTAAVALSSASGAVVLVLLSPSPANPVAAADRTQLLLISAVIVVAALAMPGLRLVAGAGASALVVAALPWPPSSMLLSTVVLTAAALFGAAASTPIVWTRPWVRAAGSVMVAAVAASVFATGLTALRPPRSDAAHIALAGWIDSAAAPDATIDAQPGVRADLVRDGIPPSRIVDGGSLVVAPIGGGPDDPGPRTLIARFGDPTAQLGVFTEAHSTDGAADSAARADVGGQLAANPNLMAPTVVRDALASGAVDARVLVILAGLAGRGPVRVDDLPAVAGESATQPLHRLTLHDIDASTRAWLAVQRPPFAPLSAPDTTLTWPVPATTALLGP